MFTKANNVASITEPTAVQNLTPGIVQMAIDLDCPIMAYQGDTAIGLHTDDLRVDYAALKGLTIRKATVSKLKRLKAQAKKVDIDSLMCGEEMMSPTRVRH